jgi:hypothetical protein
MPITINGSGTVTGISAGGLPDGVITTDDIAANAVTFAKIGTTEQGQLCKAWVNFNGTGTVAIRASYNVSSITDHGIGIYTVNFTSSLPDANFSAVCIAADDNVTNTPVCLNSATPLTTSGVRINAFAANTASGGQRDPSVVCVAIFR